MLREIRHNILNKKWCGSTRVAYPFIRTKYKVFRYN